MPRTVGTYEDLDVTIGIGRFGPYVKHENKFVSLAKTDDPYTIELERAIELIEAKRKAERERIIQKFEDRPDVQLLNGRWGPYLVVGDQNFKLPKGTDPTKLNLEDCLEIAADEKNLSVGKSSRFKKKAPAKTEAPVKKLPAKKAAAKKTAAKKTAAKKTATTPTAPKTAAKKSAGKSTATKAAASTKAAPRKKTKK